MQIQMLAIAGDEEKKWIKSGESTGAIPNETSGKAASGNCTPASVAKSSITHGIGRDFRADQNCQISEI